MEICQQAETQIEAAQACSELFGQRFIGVTQGIDSQQNLIFDQDEPRFLFAQHSSVILNRQVFDIAVIQLAAAQLDHRRTPIDLMQKAGT